MDIFNAALGLLFVLIGVLVLVLLHRNGDFDKGAKITRNTIGLIFAGAVGIIAGIYFIITS